MSGEFDWQDAETIIAREQPATACYVNRLGQIVVRQKAAWNEEADPTIVVNAEHAIALAYSILDCTDRPLEITERCDGGWTDVPRPPRPADLADKPEPEAEPDRLALPAPDHRREHVTADLFGTRGDAGS